VPGFVVDAQLDGRLRRITFASGAVATEELVSVDDDRRRLVYRVVQSGLAFEHYEASVEVDERDGTSSRITWTIDLLPDDRLDVVEGLMSQGGAAMARAFSR
jgi:Polyketide cyclase / dehydrase and lipid transport